MKRFLAILLTILTVCLIVPLPAMAATDAAATITVATVVNVKKDVNVRAGADTNAALIGVAGKNTKYAVLEKTGDWYKVLYNGQTGYISAKYLSIKKIKTKLSAAVNISVGTFNVHALGYGAKVDEVAKALKNAKLDVVGVQEVDRFTSRSGNEDWPKILAEKAGFPYYYYCPTTRLGGGQYGTLILSRLPILSGEAIPLSVPRGAEARALCYVQLMTNKGVINFFNTHLTNGTDSQKAAGVRAMNAKIQALNLPSFVVSGDYNISANILMQYLPAGVSAANENISTFGRGANTRAIDNFLHSKKVTVSKLNTVDTITAGISDHKLLTARVKIGKD